MTERTNRSEEQRRQAAAQRCAELANAIDDACWVAKDFSEPSSANVPIALLNAILQLDELAREVLQFIDYVVMVRPNSPAAKLRASATALILPEPKPSPVERLANEYSLDHDALLYRLDTLGLKLVEVDPSDDR